ncbi:MAG: hypothetical protein HY059_05450 [Proteobacteria bacterium]|nr:hypothetical protein [Pseudomonadota bacterium]
MRERTVTRRAASALAGAACLAVVASCTPRSGPATGAPRAPGGVEQTQQGTRDDLALLASFDGLGVGFSGPQGTAFVRNPSDNSLAVGPDHIVQIVNSRMAVFTKKGTRYDSTGVVLYGPVPTNTIFKGFGGQCEARLSGDAVVRYDQLADRWLFVLPIFQRGPVRPDQIAASKAGDPAQLSVVGRAGQPGGAAPLFVPPPPPPADPNAPPSAPRGRGGAAGQPQAQGPYSMCYAVSTSSDPMGSYYRYEFLRPLFPDYPRPAVWPDGYYVPTSTSDDRISETVATQKHACVADRARMLKGEPATEQCLIIENVNFLNNADVDGKRLPPAGAPNIMMAAGGRQLDRNFADSVINVWQFHVDWADPAKTRVMGPDAIPVAPYHYLCDGQLSNCVPQAGTDRRLDAQGDKLMARLTYRNVDGHESIVATHSVNSAAGAGGVRWYEFRVDAKDRTVRLHQQGTFAPDSMYRWMGSAAMDKRGDLIIGYSHGGAGRYAGQRAAARRAGDPNGRLTSREVVLAEGAAPQTNTLRWEDYTQTAVDPSDDCTVWYVGDYFKKDATSYSSRIGAFRLRGCR